MIIPDSEPLPFRTKVNLPLHINQHCIQSSRLDLTQGAHGLLFPLLLLTVADERFTLSRTIAQNPRPRMSKHTLVGSHPPCLFVRLLPSPLSEHVNDASPEFSERFRRIYRVAKRFEPRRAVVFQIAFYSGWIRNVDLVGEAFDMQEGEDAARIEH